MPDRVLRTDPFGLVLICTAIIVHRIAHFTAGHGFSTVSALQKSAEKIQLILLRSRSRVPEQKPLDLFKSLPVNDCLVGVFYNIPFILGNGLLNMDFIALYPVAALHHIPAIHTIFENRRNGHSTP